MQPRKTAAQRLERFHLEVSPDAELSSSVDYFGNAVWLVSVEAPHLELVITAHSEVSVMATAEVRLDPILAREPVLHYSILQKGRPFEMSQRSD